MRISRGWLLVLLPLLLLDTGCLRRTQLAGPGTTLPQATAEPSADFMHERKPSGEMLAVGCFGCHGPQGRSATDAIPSLAGLSETYFKGVMQAYRHGGRFSTVMGRIALGYEPQEIEQLARYFAALQPSPRKQRVDWELVSQGRRLHRHYCWECHGDLQQRPAHEDAVALNGQGMHYLRWTLRDYLVGINQTDPEMTQQLGALVRRHGAPGIEALVHYYGSMRP